jgi:hypothetical protein
MLLVRWQSEEHGVGICFFESDTDRIPLCAFSLLVFGNLGTNFI